MAEGDSPTIARRRVRLTLREARERANLTQLQVAEQMEWSLSKVIRIENGDVSISPNDLRPLLGYLGVKDKTTVAALLADARLARTRQRQAWYQRPDMREHLTDALRRLFEYEAEARVIRYYAVNFVPGPLQVPEYAAALMNLYDDELNPGQVDGRLAARQQRRRTLLERAPSVDIQVLLDESVFMRPAGGVAVFLEQLAELERLVAEDLIKLRTVPFDVAAAVTNNASFDLLTLGEGADGGEVLYRETGLFDEIVEDRTSTSRHRDRFDKLWHEVVDEANTRALIRRRIEYLRGVLNTRSEEQ